LFLTWNFSYKFRNGSYSYYNSETSNIEEVNYSPYWLLDAKIKYNLKNITFFVEATNILNKKYYDLSYVVLPGRWLKAGISIHFTDNNVL
jgi:iron complex outermembrane receptor protein